MGFFSNFGGGGMFGGGGGDSSNPFGSMSGMGGLGDFFGSLGLPGGTNPEKIYGKKPVVPELSEATQKAIADAEKAFPGASELAAKVNEFNQAQKNAMLEMVAPGWKENMAKAGVDIEQMLEGVLPQSDAQLRQLKSVAQGFNLGLTGGGTQLGHLVARDLGLEQQAVIQAGLSANERWVATAERLQAPTFDFTKMFPTPQEEYAVDWQKAIIEAAPDPVARGVADEWNALIGEVLSVYSGGAGYQNTYRPTYGGSPLSGGGGGGGGFGGGGGGTGYLSYSPQGQNLNVNFGAPITSPGVSYDVGPSYGGGGGADFGAAITAPGLW